MKIIVVGGGPGGYVAAIHAAIKGAEVTLVEKQAVGGTCLNRGCIPTKAFLKGTDALHDVMSANQFGIRVGGEMDADFATIFKRKQMVVNQLVGGVGFLLKKRGVAVENGFGKLVSEKEVQVTYADGTEKVLEADRIILATGSVPIVPPMFGYDGNLVFTSDEALAMSALPESIIIVGGGVIGCEFGEFYARMGVAVSIVEMAPHILPQEDTDVAATLKKALVGEKIAIYEGTGVESVTKNENSVSAKLSNGETITAECMLVAIGRKANIEGCGVEEVGILTDKGKILTNNKMETSVDGIYAIGDIVNTPFLAHVASREGVVAADNALGKDEMDATRIKHSMEFLTNADDGVKHALQESTVSYKAVPRCVYTEPEVAAVGLTEVQAKEKGIAYKVGKFQFSGNGKAMVGGKTAGFVKILADEKGVIIGGQIVGAHATEMLGEITMAVHIGMTVDVAGEIIHPHPTMSEAIMEAIHTLQGHCVHGM